MFFFCFQVIAVLVRCCDVSSRCQSANAADSVLPLLNPYADPSSNTNGPAHPQLSVTAADILYNRSGYGILDVTLSVLHLIPAEYSDDTVIVETCQNGKTVR